MNDKTVIEVAFRVMWIMQIEEVLSTSAFSSVDNILLDLHNSHPTKTECTIAKYHTKVIV